MRGPAAEQVAAPWGHTPSFVPFSAALTFARTTFPSATRVGLRVA